MDYRIRIRSAKEAVEASGFIGFVNPEADRNGKDLLQQLTSAQGELTVTATIYHRFFTMLPDMEAYRRLVQTLDADDATKALTALNDLVALSEFESTSAILDLATQSEVFSLSFMRLIYCSTIASRATGRTALIASAIMMIPVSIHVAGIAP